MDEAPGQTGENVNETLSNQDLRRKSLADSYSWFYGSAPALDPTPYALYGIELAPLQAGHESDVTCSTT
jgi:hypothetical protein